jgi:hypothetical protein
MKLREGAWESETGKSTMMRGTGMCSVPTSTILLY